MTQQELIERHAQVCKEARHLMEKKNSDYGGDQDPFANFRLSEHLGVDPRLGILVRMSDKLSRLATLTSGAEPKVKDEKIDDTCRDLVNYAVLFLALHESEPKGKTLVQVFAEEEEKEKE